MNPLQRYIWRIVAVLFISMAAWAIPCLAAPTITLDPKAKPEDAFLKWEQDTLKKKSGYTQESLRTYCGAPLSLPPGEVAAYSDLEDPEWYTYNIQYSDLVKAEPTILRLAIRGNALAMAYMDLIYKLYDTPDSYFVNKYPNSAMMRKDFWSSWANRFVNPNWVQFEQRKKEDTFATSYTIPSAAGHPPSMYALSRLPETWVYPMYLLVASARMGYAEAQYQLAISIMEPKEIPPKRPDLDSALKYLALAAEQGHPEANYLYARILIEPTDYFRIKPGHSLQADPLEGAKRVYIAKALRASQMQTYEGGYFLDILARGKRPSVTPEILTEGKRLAEQWLSDFQKKQEAMLAPERARRANLLEEMHNELGPELVNELMGFSKSHGPGRWRESAQ